MLSKGIRPDFYCAPILKTEYDRLALVQAAISGSNKFFLGTDKNSTARHLTHCAHDDFDTLYLIVLFKRSILSIWTITLKPQNCELHTNFDQVKGVSLCKVFRPIKT